jgi:CBS domain-containing protein
LDPEEDMKAQDIMTKNPRTVTPDADVREAARIMKDENVGVVPVVESAGSKKLVGMLTDRDIAVRVVAEGKASARVQEIMSGSPRSVKAGDSVSDVMELMGKEQVRRVPVIDDRGDLVGIVAQADVVRQVKDDKKAERTIEKISEPGGRHTQ